MRMQFVNGNVWVKNNSKVWGADLLVENTAFVELKAARCLDPAHEAQLLNYLRATEIEIGLLLNFGQKPEFKRLVYENSRKKSRAADQRG